MWASCRKRDRLRTRERTADAFAITAFSALLFVARGWAAWPAFTVFATVFIMTRILLGHLTDRFGGAKVALVCGLIEAAGLALIWLAPHDRRARCGQYDPWLSKPIFSRMYVAPDEPCICAGRGSD
jgi:MFS family permease